MASSLANGFFAITGAASGMGFATATTLLAKGASLALCNMNQDGLSKFVHKFDRIQKNRVITDVID